MRPGEEPDFSDIQIPPAGAVNRPDVAADPATTRELVYTLVRVLDDEGKAVGQWDPHLDAGTLRDMLRDMITLRAYDDRMYRAQRQGKDELLHEGDGRGGRCHRRGPCTRSR
jgi:2-oxoisovalerate dehydrogenase E1 component alpha subunit